MKRTYMLAVQATIVLKPTIYYEVIAENAEQALKQLKKAEAKKLLDTHKEEFLAEANGELEYAALERVRVINCGRADQYHSDSECEMCASLIKKAA